MAYLTLLVGSAGLRKEENLAITPADVQILKMPTSQGVKKYVLLNVHAAYTDEDGLKVTKTEESNRHALVLPEFTERFLSALEATKPSIEQVEGCWLIRHKTNWHKSRKAKYRIETVMGNRKDAQAVASRLAAETAAKYKLGSNPKLKEGAGFGLSPFLTDMSTPWRGPSRRKRSLEPNKMQRDTLWSSGATGESFRVPAKHCVATGKPR